MSKMNKLLIVNFIIATLPTFALAENVLKSIDYNMTLEEQVEFDTNSFQYLIEDLDLAIQGTNGRFYYGDLEEEEEVQIRKHLQNIAAFIDPNYSEPEVIFNNKQEYILFKK